MLAGFMLATGCGFQTRTSQKTTTTPFSTPAGKRPLTLCAGTYGGWMYAMSTADGQVRWHATPGAGVWVWPLLANGVLYDVSVPRVEARSPTDGTVRWHVQLFDQPNRSIIAAPVIDHGVIYVAIIGVNGVRFGEIEALSATDGSVLWRFSTPGQNSGGIGGISPVVADGVVYVAGDVLYVLRASDGHLIRRIEAGGRFDTTPAIQAGIAYITMNESPGSGSAIEAVRVADGARLWYKHISDGAARGLLVAGDSVYASGFIDTNVAGTPGTDGTGSGYGLLYALHPSDGSVQWTIRASGGFSMAPALDGNTLYAGSGDGYLHLIDRTNGTLLRRYRIDQGQYTNSQRYDTIWTTPIVRDGTLYFAATTWDTLFPFHVGERRGAVFAMRERDGVILWEADLLGWVSLLQVSAT